MRPMPAKKTDEAGATGAERRILDPGEDRIICFPEAQSTWRCYLSV